MKEKTRWGGSYFGISEIHSHQKFITLGKIFLCLFPHCTEHTLNTPALTWCCNVQEEGMCTGSGACCAHTVPMPCIAGVAKKY